VDLQLSARGPADEIDHVRSARMICGVLVT